MKNTVYGKTMENLRNRIDAKLVNNKENYLKWTSKPSYIPHKIFDNNLVTICKNTVTLTLNKPAYVGMSILDLNKLLMYEFHYDYINNKFGNNLTLSFTDTDSLMYKNKTEYVNEDFSKDEEMFDFSNYSTGSKYYHDSNKLVVGEMKDEEPGVVIKEFVRLKPKMYSFFVDDSSEHKKAKSF